jgi:hypothetical protein
LTSDKVNKMLVGNKCDLTTKKVVDYTTAKVRLRLLLCLVALCARHAFCAGIRRFPRNSLLGNIGEELHKRRAGRRIIALPAPFF